MMAFLFSASHTSKAILALSIGLTRKSVGVRVGVESEATMRKNLKTLIGEALAVCDEILAAQAALVADLDADSSSMLDPWAWLRWASGTDADDHDHGFKALCDSCDTEASVLIRDQLLLPKVAKLRAMMA